MIKILPAPRIIPWPNPYTSVISFGDSFSDNGFINGHGFQRYTNTWTWVEYLSQMLGLENDNWAFGGAMTNERNQAHPPEISWSGLAWQVAEFLKNPAPDLGTALVTVACSSNDYFGGQLDGNVSAANIRKAMDDLVRAGAKNFVYRETSAVVMAPGFFTEDGAKDFEGWRKLVQDANLATRVELDERFRKEHPNVSLIYQQTDPLMTKIKNGEPGFKFEIIDKMWLGTYEFPEPYKYLWWDNWHAMGQFHLMVAEETLEAVKINQNTKKL